MKAILAFISAIALYVSGFISFFGGCLWLLLYVIEYDKIARLSHILHISLFTFCVSCLVLFLIGISED